MLTLNISQQYAKIDITTVRADSNLTTTPPRLMINTEAATVEISQPEGELEIDWRPFRASYGIKDNDQFARDNAERGRQIAFDTIGRIAQDGDQLANIESGQDAVAALAAEANVTPVPEVIWAWLEPPAIQYTAHQPEFRPTPARFSTELIRGTVNINYQPYQVNIRMAQYPSITMWVTGYNDIDIRA